MRSGFLICAAVSVLVGSCGDPTKSPESPNPPSPTPGEVRAVSLSEHAVLFLNQEWADVIITGPITAREMVRIESSLRQIEQKCSTPRKCEIEAKAGKVRELLQHFEILEVIESWDRTRVVSEICTPRLGGELLAEVRAERLGQLVLLRTPRDERFGEALHDSIGEMTGASRPGDRPRPSDDPRLDPSGGVDPLCKECDPRSAGCGAVKPPPGVEYTGGTVVDCDYRCEAGAPARGCNCGE